MHKMMRAVARVGGLRSRKWKMEVSDTRKAESLEFGN